MKLTYKKGKGDKIHIHVDGEYAFTVDEGYFYSLSIENGQEIDSARLNEITEKAGERRAYNYAVSLLSRRDHSSGEIKRKLEQKDYGDFSRAVCEKLMYQGYLDDLRFAESYVNELISVRGYGKKRIEQELWRKGIDRDTARQAIESASFENGRLEELIRKKYLRYLDSEKGVQKTVNALLRLGYSYGEIKDSLKSVENYEEFFEVYDE